MKNQIKKGVSIQTNYCQIKISLILSVKFYPEILVNWGSVLRVSDDTIQFSMIIFVRHHIIIHYTTLLCTALHTTLLSTTLHYTIFYIKPRYTTSTRFTHILLSNLLRTEKEDWVRNYRFSKNTTFSGTDITLFLFIL